MPSNSKAQAFIFQIIERGRAQEDDSRKSTQFKSFSRKQGGEGFHREVLSQLSSNLK